MTAAAPSPTSSATPQAPNRLGDLLLWLLLTLLALSLPQKPLLELDSSWRQALAYFFQHGYPFGERNGVGQNERGVYLGVRVRPSRAWTINAYDPILQLWPGVTLGVRLTL